jgi:hypothetical protein
LCTSIWHRNRRRKAALPEQERGRDHARYRDLEEGKKYTGVRISTRHGKEVPTLKLLLGYLELRIYQANRKPSKADQ